MKLIRIHDKDTLRFVLTFTLWSLVAHRVTFLVKAGFCPKFWELLGYKINLK